MYIGQTTKEKGFKGRYPCKGEGIERVYNYYLQRIKNEENYNVYLLNSIKKYSFNAFEVKEEFDVAYSKDELDKKEIYWIKYYKSNNKKFGYNSTIGGDGNRFSKDSYINNIGKRYKPIICIETKEIFLTLSEAQEKTGIHVHSITNNCNGKTKYASTKSGLKMRFKRIDKNEAFARRPVICLNTGEVFLTPTEAGEKYHCKASNISDCCKGVRKSAGKDLVTGKKLIWMYAIDNKLNTVVI